jgi:hypothetical protein
MRLAECTYSPILLNSGVIESIAESDLKRVSESVGLWAPIVFIALTNIRESFSARASAVEPHSRRLTADWVEVLDKNGRV